MPSHDRVHAALLTLALAGCASDTLDAIGDSGLAADDAATASSQAGMGAAGSGGTTDPGDAAALAVKPLQPAPDASDADTQPVDAGLDDATTAPVDNAGDAEAANDTGDADTGDADTGDAGMPPLGEDAEPYARGIASFSAGDSAGFGADGYPDVVLGPPMGLGTGAGSLDVLSLGVGGVIVLDFGDVAIVDGDGADFIVFENPFWPGGDATQVFAELGQVSVSEDGSTWYSFPCDSVGTGDGRFPGCAGWTPTLDFDPLVVVPLDPARTGGDAFDLADLGVTRARYVRIEDLSDSGSGITAGFDLDAVGLVHFEALP